MARRQQSFSTAYKDARGNLWSDYTNPDTGESTPMAVQASQDENGNTVYTPIAQTDAGVLNGQQGLPDASRLKAGDVLTPQEYQNYAQNVLNPALYQGINGLTADSLVTDPRSMVRMENGQYVYRPDSATQQLQIAPDSHSFGGLVKGFLTSPGVAMTLPAIGAAALGQMGLIGNAAGTTDAANLAANSPPSSYWNMVAGEAPKADITAGIGNLSGSTGSAADEFLNSMSGLVPTNAPQAAMGASGIGSAGDEFLNTMSEFVPGGAGTTNLKDLLSAASVGSNVAQLQKRQTPAEAASEVLKQLGVNVAPATLGLLGTGLATGLGAYAANQQSNASDKLASQFMDMGAPYRNALSDLVSNPNNFYGSPMIQGALQQGSDALARSLSAKVGNPILNPSALQQMQNYTTRGLLDQYNNQFNNLARAGGLGVSQASSLGTNAIAAQGGVPNALGSGLASVFNNQPDYAGVLADLLKRSPIGQSYLGSQY